MGGAVPVLCNNFHILIFVIAVFLADIIQGEDIEKPNSQKRSHRPYENDFSSLSKLLITQHDEPFNDVQTHDELLNDEQVRNEHSHDEGQSHDEDDGTEYGTSSKTQLQWNELSSQGLENSDDIAPEDSLTSSSEYYTDPDEGVVDVIDGDSHKNELDSFSDELVRIKADKSSDVSGASKKRPQLRLTPIVTTRYGQVQGMYQEVSGAQEQVIVYLGVPYATPPVNANRLSPTRAATQWRGVLAATTHPPACPQNPPSKYQKLFQHQSEDCLYLNIYVPGEGYNICKCVCKGLQCSVQWLLQAVQWLQ